MDTTQRRALLGRMGLSPDLLAVDPAGCGCTECIIGEYVPADRIPPEQIPVFQNLIRDGVLDDHTSGWFMIGAEEPTFTREDMAKAWTNAQTALRREMKGLGFTPNPYEEV